MSQNKPAGQKEALLADRLNNELAGKRIDDFLIENL